ncbi:biotin-dependent carboxyltransferase family protein [Metabacillus litoralis]|uniref:5-oxoprolinase subunit C family protein n=1 Tax=Metabacillus litoralis TaxID=152268 RepID=UPI001CFD42D9|nr:biotin-dependent carboxyltransferase family protein [Metabacillus litoralis]
MTIEVLEPGLSTTVQDLGRYGFQEYGVVVSGVMDEYAAKIANALVGNNDDDPLLEITLIGPTLVFKSEAIISICGADLSAKIDGVDITLWRPVYIKPGSVLTFGRPIEGCRCYLAVAGGYDVPIVMNSSSTYSRGAIGGYHGRPLKKDDLLKINEFSSENNKILLRYLSELSCSKSGFTSVSWTVSSQIKEIYRRKSVIRFMKGPQYFDFTKKSLENFETIPFQVKTNSDRMGYRLQSTKLEYNQKKDLLSEAVTKGTIQVPHDGQPIILMADCQTIGGYPKIGYVATVDLPILSQVIPGEKISFEEISLGDAQKLLINREKLVKQLKIGLFLAIRRMVHGATG